MLDLALDLPGVESLILGLPWRRLRRERSGGWHRFGADRTLEHAVVTDQLEQIKLRQLAQVIARCNERSLDSDRGRTLCTKSGDMTGKAQARSSDEIGRFLAHAGSGADTAPSHASPAGFWPLLRARERRGD
jgi:hypothetical protein